MTRDRIREYEAFCVRHGGWAVDLVEALVRNESPTTDKVAVDRCVTNWRAGWATSELT